MKLKTYGAFYWTMFAIAALHAGWARASEASGAGNGGDAVVLTDDSVVLADPFIQRSGKPGILHPLLIEELKRAGRFLVRYGAKGYVESEAAPTSLKALLSAVDPHFRRLEVEHKFLWRQIKSLAGEQSLVIRDEVLDSLVEFHFVAELPSDCPAEHTLTTKPQIKAHKRVACTRGVMTWIKRDLFYKMSIREQAKTILHERLHAFSPEAAEEIVADLIGGLETLLALYNFQNNGVQEEVSRFRVSTDDLARIETMRRRIVQAGLVDREAGKQLLLNYIVTPNGGGLVHRNARMSPTSVVGVGAILSDESQIHDNAKLLNTSTMGSKVVLGPHVIVKDSFLSFDFDSYPKPIAFAFQGGAQIIASRVLIDSHDAGNPSVEAPGRFAENSKVVASTIISRGIRLGGAATIENTNLFGVSIDFGHSYYVPQVNMPVLFLENSASLSDLAFGVLYLPSYDGRGHLPEITVPFGRSLNFGGASLCGENEVAAKMLSPKVYLQSEGDLRTLCNKSSTK